MKNFKTIKLYLFLPLLLFVSCAPIYTPNVVHVPLFSEKHDADLQFGMGTAGYDVQAAYAPTNYIGVMVNSSYQFKDVADTSSYHKHNFVEAGIGYYGKIEEAGRFECFAGFGSGEAKSYSRDFWGYVSGNYNRFFIQPSIGAKMDVFEGAFSCRVAYVDMYQFSGTTNYNRSQMNTFYFEPVLTAKAGYKFVKFFVQGGLSMPIESNLKYTDQPFILNFGLNFSFSKSYLKE